jgi:hypothetical protein
MDQLRAHVKERGFKHWRVTYSKWRGPGHTDDVTAYKTFTGVQFTLRGPAKDVARAVDVIEEGA